MPLILKECTDFSTFSPIVDCEWAGYHDPYHPFMQILFPVFGETAEAKAAALQESEERQWQWHSTDPTSHSLYIEDNETGEIVGGAQWHFHETNPWEKPQPKLDAYWWPKGECKWFVNEMLEQVYRPRRVKMTRPHMLLNIMFVYPKHRQRGAGALMMEWGMDKAKEKKIETFVEATDMGKLLYERFGLREMYVAHLHGSHPDSSEEWTKMERELLPMHYYFMWKPAEGFNEKGKTVVPWKIGRNGNLKRLSGSEGARLSHGAIMILWTIAE